MFTLLFFCWWLQPAVALAAAVAYASWYRPAYELLFLACCIDVFYGLPAGVPLPAVTCAVGAILLTVGWLHPRLFFSVRDTL